MQLLDSTQWRKAIARALRNSYSDIFVLKSKPSKSDKAAIIGKYKTTYNVNELAAERATNTFLSLLDLADQSALHGPQESSSVVAKPADDATPATIVTEVIDTVPQPILPKAPLDLCYNIQIHLPPTKDIEVYNAIFKSLREHFVD